MAEVALIGRYLVLTLLLNKKNKNKHKNERTEYHDISIPFKSQAYSKQGSEFQISFVWVIELLVREKLFPENSNLQNLVDIQR